MPTNPGDKARNQLLANERRRQLAVVSEFEKIKRRLEAELKDLLERIDKERVTQGNASPGLILKKARVGKLLDDVTREIDDASKRLGTIVRGAQRRAVDIAEAQAGDYPKLQADVVGSFDAAATRELIGIAGDGQPLEILFRRLAKPARQAMFDALFFGVASGASNQQIAKEVREAIGGTTANAMTIVRTETNRAYREATRQFYADVPAVIGWRWLAALDLRTCPICWALHGKVFKTKTKFGTHPNCRCTMVPVFAGDAAVPTGPELFAKLNETQQKAILGPGRLALYKDGAELSHFVEQTKTPFGIGRRVRNIVDTKFRKRPRPPGIPPIPPPKGGAVPVNRRPPNS